jgi:WD40 repeat protein
MTRRYRIFLSSPTDVTIERDHAEEVLKRLNANRVDLPGLEVVRWETEYYTAQADFQAQIPKPSECDLVICIFWKRLGTDLSEIYARGDGTLPTGTEYEFEEALAGAAADPNKLPDVLVYKKTAPVMFSASTLEFEQAQYERFQAFWQRWFRSEKGHFLAGFTSFATPDEFASVLERNVVAWLQHRETDVTWTHGSPYRGLEPFEFEHAPIFFGRRREVERARARLIASATGGKPFLLIVGASGAGKSSLVRAGLIPRLAQPGGLSTLAASMRWTIVTPGKLGSNWSVGLAARLSDKEVLGHELRLGDFSDEHMLAEQLARADSSAILPIAGALRRIRESRCAEQQERQTAFLLFVDQLEELFAWPSEQACHFLSLLVQLCHIPGTPVLVVATMRSDFQHRIAEYQSLAVLAGRSDVKGPYDGDQMLELSLPAPSDLREMILNPTHAAGLSFEVNRERDLFQLIEAGARPEAMPSVQFLLAELYAARQGKLLTLEAFDKLRGVEGVMATRSEQVYLGADRESRTAFPRVVRAMVTQIRNDVPASSRRISETAFFNDVPAANLVERLKEARLIISDRGELRFSHDSLLTSWDRLKEQIAEEQRLLEARERLEGYCERWEKAPSGRSKKNRLLQGFALAEGRELLTKWGADALKDKQADLPAYISASDEREKRVRWVTQAVGWCIAFVLAGFSLVLFDQLQRTAQAQKETQASLWIAQSEADLRNGNVASAIDLADRAFTSVPTEQSRSTLLSALMQVSPHLVSAIPLKGEVSSALTWLDDTTLASASASGRSQTFRPLRSTLGEPAADTINLKAVPTSPGVAFWTLSSDNLLVVLADGSTGVLRKGSKVLLQAAGQAKLPNPAAHAIATSNSGSTIVSAAYDKSINLYRCDWTNAQRPCDDPKELSQAHGLAVTVRPDGERFAVGRQDGKVMLFNSAGGLIGEWTPLAPLVALQWNPKQDLVAAGTSNGDVVILDASSPSSAPVFETRFGDKPITALAWSADGLNLAAVCHEDVICLLRSDLDAQQRRRFKPAIRLEGHKAGVTRLAWTPTGHRLASSALDASIRVWDLSPNTDVSYWLYSDEPAELVTLAGEPAAKKVAAGAKDGSIRTWTLPSIVPMSLSRPAESEIRALVWATDGTIAGLHSDGKVSLTSSTSERVIPLEKFGVGSRVAWADDGNVLAITLRNGQIALIDTTQSSGAQVKLLDRGLPNFATTGIAVDRARRTAFASYSSGDTVAWDLTTGKWSLMRSGRKVDVGAGSLASSSDGKWLATSGADPFIRIYDVKKLVEEVGAKTESSETMTVAFSPNGQRLAALGADNRIYIWSFVDGKAARLVTFSPARSVVEGEYRQNDRIGWLAWVSDETIAMVNGPAGISVVQLNSDKWRGRANDLIANR